MEHHVVSTGASAFSCMLFPCFGIVGLALFAFWIWMIVDCATKEPNEGNTKVIWILVIALTYPIGALIYYLVRRPQRIQEFGK